MASLFSWLFVFLDALSKLQVEASLEEKFSLDLRLVIDKSRVGQSWRLSRELIVTAASMLVVEARSAAKACSGIRGDLTSTKEVVEERISGAQSILQDFLVLSLSLKREGIGSITTTCSLFNYRAGT